MSMQAWQIVRLADAVPMPWRNAGGLTRELLAWPDPRAWDWRISVAEVASDGPFSRFEGVQRWLAILRGVGVRLIIAGKVVELTPLSAPLAFDGGDPASCQLLAGAVRDLNLMVRRGGNGAAATSRMQRIAGTSRIRVEPAIAVALYSGPAPARVRLGGVAFAVAAESLAWRSLPTGGVVEIEAVDAIWMEIPS